MPHRKTISKVIYMYKEYDPRNLEDEYLEEDIIKQAIQRTLEKFNNPSMYEMDAFIPTYTYEREKMKSVKSGIDPERNMEDFDKINLDFLAKYGEWIHHTSIYKEFYNQVDKILRSLK